MKVSITAQDDISIIEVSGDIDSKTAPEFEKSAKEAAAQSTKIAIDLTAVEYMSSAGLRVLLMVYRNIKSQNGKVVLVGVSEDIQDVMSTTGFINFFSIVPTLDEGVAILKQG
ncbi:Putative anti-sigma factor antagonist [Dyadobacter sp. CECT 9275]|uniref:Anti-sigma factor antagonist n=1 Tax=Dyadobacter helix TaxID=2822344 RepID=A0A916JCA2_9BACT|nr:STAS domain-containing protein [Dyadobacter sp. CECT 9275]CAG4998440.1 Putative anti-sigma factor antagonist [Dyadobacter sp. CECT 9275]